MPYSLPPRNDGDKIGLFHQGGLSPQLVVRSFDSEIDSPGNYIVYKGGVKAKYGDSELTADVLIVRKGDSSDPAIPLNEGGYTINLRAKEAYAFGKVTVTDPDGNLKASRLWFTWDGQSEFRKGEVLGRAEDVELSIATTQIVAKTLSMTSAGFDLTNIGFWTSNWRTPLFRFDADSVFIYPGKKGVAKNVRTSLLGVQLPVLPRYTFSLDPRSEGFQVPTVGFRQGAGVGISWQSKFLINDKSAFSTALTAFPDVQPTYTLSYSKSNLRKDDVGKKQFSISNQFGERSDFSFFSDIYTKSIGDAFDRMKVRKDLFSVNSTFNYETLGRVTDRVTNYSLPLELGFEKGGPAGSWAYLMQAKVAKIVEAGSNSATRFTLQASTFAPVLSFGRTSIGARFDATARIDATSSGFFGAETGISYEAANALRFSAGAYGYKNLGNELFLGDQFTTNQGYIVRGDWFGPSTGFSFLYRYDPTKGWFDREYRISQVMGPIEPVLVYRQNPRQYVIGIKFRTQGIANMLAKRSSRQADEAEGKKPR